MAAMNDTNTPSPDVLSALSDLDLAEIIAEAVSDHNEMGDVAWDRVARDVRKAVSEFLAGGYLAFAEARS